MSAVSTFEIKSKKIDKIFNFLKGCFSVMGDPIDMIFGVLLETYLKLLKCIIFQFFSKYSKSYNNLNVKKYLKLKGHLKKDEPSWGHPTTWN